MEKKDEFRHRLLLTLSILALCGIILLLVLRFTDNSLAKFTYFPYEDGIMIEGYSGDSSTLNVPEEIDGKRVVAIAEGAFTAQKKLRKITLPESVTEIGPRAFADCESLSRVEAPGVTVVGIEAFQACNNLKEITLSASLTSVGDRAFHSCGKLRALTAPATLTEIGTDAFAGCGNLAMDVSQNALAAEVAEQYGISTDGSDTSSGMWLRIGGVTLLMGAFVAVIWFIIARSNKAKRGR